MKINYAGRYLFRWEKGYTSRCSRKSGRGPVVSGGRESGDQHIARQKMSGVTEDIWRRSTCTYMFFLPV